MGWVWGLGSAGTLAAETGSPGLSPGQPEPVGEKVECSMLFPEMLFSPDPFFFLATSRSMWDLSSPTRDRTQAHSSESAES